MKQASFLPKIDKKLPRAHGGGIHHGKRKGARPFSPRLPLHVVFRALKAKGEYSLLRPAHKHFIEIVLARYSKRFHIKIYQMQNVGNHLHLILQTKTKSKDLARLELANFLRRLSGVIAMHITHAKKGQAFGKFWDELVYTRIVTFGREFNILQDYLIKNLFEAHALWNRKKYPDWSLITIRAGVG